MHNYPRNSPEAAARLVALVLISDGHVCRSEIEALEQLAERAGEIDLAIATLGRLDEFAANGGLAALLASGARLCEQVMLLDALASEEDAPRLAMRRTGVGVAIDDFGTGYSSLAYLNRLPVTKLKLDQSFVRDIPADPNGVAIARSVLRLGEILGLEVVAEGVENQDQAQFLKREHCDYLQGFLISPPVPAIVVPYNGTSGTSW